MPGSDGLRILGFEKKAGNWDLDLDEASWFSELAEVRPVWVYGMPARWLSQWVESWRWTNSQHSKKLCLSLLMSENLKLKKVNKFRTWTKRESSSVSSIFGFLYTYEYYERFMHVNILVVFLDLCIIFGPPHTQTILKHR